MHIFKRKVFFLLFVIKLSLVGCVNNEQPIEIVEERTAQSIDTSANISDLSVDSEFENLLTLNHKIFHSKTDVSDVISFTEQYVINLQNYINSNKSLDCIEHNIGIKIITPTRFDNKYVFNLVRYDGNSSGFGTLEKTWTFLQIIKDSNINVYTLFDKSAEFPLYIKISELSNKNFVISVAGVTNASRNYTAFISFWEYSSDGLNEYNDVSLVSEYKNDELVNNTYYIEYFNEEDVKIVDSEEELGLYDIVGSRFSVNSMIYNDTIFIKSFDLNP